MLIRFDKVSNALKHVVGWQGEGYFDSALTVSESGLYFQDAHPLLTIKNLKSVMPDDWADQYPSYDLTEAYNMGDVVKYQEEYFYAELAHSPNDPPLNSSGSVAYGWKRYDIVSSYADKVMMQGIRTMLQTLADMKKISRESKSIVERRPFFDGAGRFNAGIENRSKLVGFEITPVRAMGATVKLEKIGIQTKGARNNLIELPIYIYHSSRQEYVYKKDVFIRSDMTWVDWGVYLPYLYDDNTTTIPSTNAGGSWFICYNQNDIPDGVEAINFAKDWSREPCGTCNQGSIADWRAITKYMQISPFQYPITEYWDRQLPDISLLHWTNTTNYGLNCVVSVMCDLTDTIIAQRTIFASLLQRQVAAIVLRTMAMNPDVRVNRNQSNVSRMELLYEVDGDSRGRQGGIAKQLEDAYKAISIDLQGIDRLCLICNNGGVKYRTT